MGQVVSIIGAVALAVVGLPALIRPQVVEKLGLSASSPLGLLETRGIFGGMLVALAVVCLVSREPYAFLTAAAGLLSYALAGFVALAVDRPKLSQGLAVNAAHTLLGLLLLSGFWAW